MLIRSTTDHVEHTLPFTEKAEAALETYNSADTIATTGELEKIYDRIAAEITAAYSERGEISAPVMLVVLKGGVFFSAELAKRLTLPFEIEYVSVSSYGDGHTNKAVIVAPLPVTLQNRHVFIVEDIIETGNSLAALRDACLRMGVASLSMAVLVDKPDKRDQRDATRDLIPDFVGLTLTCDARFLVGCGLDEKGFFRNSTSLRGYNPQLFKPLLVTTSQVSSPDLNRTPSTSSAPLRTSLDGPMSPLNYDPCAMPSTCSM
jgi:hypoxanthine phosphoribosyltransferase